MTDPERPWADDLGVLGERSRLQLRSLAATRAHVFSSSVEQPKMRLFKSHPVLATLLVVGFIGALGGGAYAVATRIFIHVDRHAPSADIQRQIRGQLAAKHVNAGLDVIDSDPEHPEHRALLFSSHDPALVHDLDIEGAPHDSPTVTLDNAVLTPGDLACLDHVVEVLKTFSPGPLDAKFAAAIEPELVKCGVHPTGLAGTRHDLQVKTRQPAP